MILCDAKALKQAAAIGGKSSSTTAGAKVSHAGSFGAVMNELIITAMNKKEKDTIGIIKRTDENSRGHSAALSEVLQELLSSTKVSKTGVENSAPPASSFPALLKELTSVSKDTITSFIPTEEMNASHSDALDIVLKELLTNSKCKSIASTGKSIDVDSQAHAAIFSTVLKELVKNKKQGKEVHSSLKEYEEEEEEEEEDFDIDVHAARVHHALNLAAVLEEIDTACRARALKAVMRELVTETIPTEPEEEEGEEDVDARAARARNPNLLAALAEVETLWNTEFSPPRGNRNDAGAATLSDTMATATSTIVDDEEMTVATPPADDLVDDEGHDQNAFQKLCRMMFRRK
jgi:hypothetical protein